MTEPGSIRDVLARTADPPSAAREVDALVSCAVAADHHECDCPLGALVVAEARRAGPAPGRLALRRAAQRLLAGTAPALRDRTLVDVAVACCESRRVGNACPLHTQYR